MEDEFDLNGLIYLSPIEPAHRAYIVRFIHNSEYLPLLSELSQLQRKLLTKTPQDR